MFMALVVSDLDLSCYMPMAERKRSAMNIDSARIRSFFKAIMWAIPMSADMYVSMGRMAVFIITL